MIWENNGPDLKGWWDHDMEQQGKPMSCPWVVGGGEGDCIRKLHVLIYVV